MVEQISRSEQIAALREPVQGLVRLASNRVRQGTVNSRGVQRIFLMSTGAGLVFKIQDEKVEHNGRAKSSAVSVGGEDHGLYVYGLNYLLSVPLEEKEFIFQLPRNPGLVTDETLASLAQKYSPQRIQEIGIAVYNATPVPEPDFKGQHERYLEMLVQENERQKVLLVTSH